MKLKLRRHIHVSRPQVRTRRHNNYCTVLHVESMEQKLKHAACSTINQMYTSYVPSKCLMNVDINTTRHTTIYYETVYSLPVEVELGTLVQK